MYQLAKWYQTGVVVLRKGILSGATLAAERKRRSREHVIADMSSHHLGYLVAQSGFTFEAVSGAIFSP